MAKLPDSSLPWPVPLEAVALIARYEGCRLRAYKCPAGVWTCGWGETQGVTPSTVWTQEQADQRLCDSLLELVAKISALLKREPTRYQMGAMVSLAYNIGMEGFARSTVLRKHNEGDEAAAARAFGLWNKARVAGVLTELAGLTARRAAEAELYLTTDEPAIKMPQAVEAESSLAASPINQSGVVTAATGAVAVAGAMVEPVKPLIKDLTEIASSIGVPAGAVVGVVLLVAGLTTVYWRWQQRRLGWA